MSTLSNDKWLNRKSQDHIIFEKMSDEWMVAFLCECLRKDNRSEFEYVTFEDKIL